MKDKILAAYLKWRNSFEDRPKHTLTEFDRRVATIAAMYSENELRHAVVMKATFNREVVETPAPRLRNNTTPQAA